MLNEILAIIKLLIDRYEKSKKQDTLNMLVHFCKNLNSYVIEYIPANELNKISMSKLVDLQEMRRNLSGAVCINNMEYMYNNCVDMYNLVMEFTNEEW